MKADDKSCGLDMQDAIRFANDSCDICEIILQNECVTRLKLCSVAWKQETAGLRYRNDVASNFFDDDSNVHAKKLIACRVNLYDNGFAAVE